jgi:hypothetical protein
MFGFDLRQAQDEPISSGGDHGIDLIGVAS